MNPRISACLVIYNEEATLGRCLDSLKDCVDEIIIVHDGECTDKSLEIAKMYTDKVISVPHIGIAEPHRVTAMEESSGDWILQIDADEFLSEELRTKLPELVSDQNVDGYTAIWPMWDGQKYKTKKWPHKPFLFRKSKLYYLGFPQEALHTSGVTKDLPYILEHQPKYNNLTWNNYKKKWLKWAKIQAEWTMKDYKEITKFGSNAENWSLRFLFLQKNAYLFPLFSIYVFLNNLKSGSWKEGKRALKSSMYWSLYFGAVYYYVWKLKRKVINAT